jgi:hypothetical protein
MLTDMFLGGRSNLSIIVLGLFLSFTKELI